MDGDTVTDFGHVVKACALGQASSSIMASHVVGARADELRALRETVRKMLKENGPPPDGRWEDIRVLEPVRGYKARHASTLLTFDAVVANEHQSDGDGVAFLADLRTRIPGCARVLVGDQRTLSAMVRAATEAGAVAGAFGSNP